MQQHVFLGEVYWQHFIEYFRIWCYWKPGWLPKLEMLSRSQLRRKPNGNHWRATKTSGQSYLNSRLHTHSDKLPQKPQPGLDMTSADSTQLLCQESEFSHWGRRFNSLKGGIFLSFKHPVQTPFIDFFIVLPFFSQNTLTLGIGWQ